MSDREIFLFCPLLFNPTLARKAMVNTICPRYVVCGLLIVAAILLPAHTVLSQRLAVSTDNLVLVSSVENGTVAQYTKVAGVWTPTSSVVLATTTATMDAEWGWAVAGSSAGFVVSSNAGVVSLRGTNGAVTCSKTFTTGASVGYALSMSADGIVAVASPSERKIYVLNQQCTVVSTIDVPATTSERVLSVIVQSQRLFAATETAVHFYSRNNLVFAYQGSVAVPIPQTVNHLWISAGDSTLHVGLSCVDNCIRVLPNPTVTMTCGALYTDPCIYTNVSDVAGLVPPFAAAAASVPTTPRTSVTAIRTRTDLILIPSTPSQLNLIGRASLPQVYLQNPTTAPLYIAARSTSVFLLVGSELLQFGAPVDGVWTAYTPKTVCQAPEGVTQTCGDGKTYEYRTCSNPYPEFGGAACQGLPTRTTDCFVYPKKWVLEQPGPCSNQVCGEGTAVRPVFCQQCPFDGSMILEDPACATTVKPPEIVQCFTWTYSWKFTDAPCRQTGCYTGIVDRTIWCERCDGLRVTDQFCSLSPRPAQQVPCDNDPATVGPFRWGTSAWSLNDWDCVRVADCGIDRYRTLNCYDCRNNFAEAGKCAAPRPVTQQKCPCIPEYFDCNWMNNNVGAGGACFRGCAGNQDWCFQNNGCGPIDCGVDWVCDDMGGNGWCTWSNCDSVYRCRYVPPPPPPPPPPGDDDDGCFSGESPVSLCDGTILRMSQLVPGLHSVRTLNGCEPLLDWFTFKPESTMTFHRICTSTSADDCVELTDGHLIYVVLDDVMKPVPKVAEAVVPGDKLLGPDRVIKTVLSTTEVRRKGIYTPLTRSSTILAGGVHCDEYGFSQKLLEARFTAPVAP